MRVGQNPAKIVKNVAKPERITAVVLNYIPFISGFYAEMLDVLKVSLQSLVSTAEIPFDLMVFDNGSCDEVKDYLVGEQKNGHIQYLFLSAKNLGKGGAWNSILSGAPGEVIAYADSDVLYFNGWLRRSMEILDTFPDVGMVTSRPFFTKKDFITHTIAWAEKNPQEVVLELGKFIPWEAYLEFDLSLGFAEEEIRKVYDSVGLERLTYRGISSIAGGSHWQFIAKKQTLQQFLPFDMDRPMGQVRQLDQRVNEAGLLRLMVPDPLVTNMSNTLRNVPGYATAKRPENLQKRWYDIPVIKYPLMRLYDRVFRMYYDR